jgi:hypothetical protein
MNMTIFVSHFCCNSEKITINFSRHANVCVYFVKMWHASRRICMARDVARQVCINAQFYPSFRLAACKCGEKCVRLWLAIDVCLTRRDVRCRPNVKMSRNDENLIRFIQSLGNHYKSVAKSKTITKMM